MRVVDTETEQKMLALFIGSVIGMGLGAYLSWVLDLIAKMMQFTIGGSILVTTIAYMWQFSPNKKMPKTVNEFFTQWRAKKKQKKVYAALEPILPDKQIVQESNYMISIPNKGQGIFVNGVTEYPDEVLKRIAFYIKYWPGQPSQNFLKRISKLMTNDNQVVDFQNFLLSKDLIEKNTKGRAGHKGYRFNERGRTFIHGLAIHYRPTPADREALKMSFKTWNVSKLGQS